MKKMMMIAALMSIGATATVVPANAQKTAVKVVKVPFAFVAGNQVLPAGTYKIEILTKSKPGPDTAEVIALRGTDVHGYASFVTMLGVAETESPKMTFKRTGYSAILTELQSAGKRFVLPRSRYDATITEAQYHFEVVPADEVASVTSDKI
jgi:hypothetical protein